MRIQHDAIEESAQADAQQQCRGAGALVVHGLLLAGGAVAGDYAESPAKPQLLLAQRLHDYYLVVPVLPLVLPPMPLPPVVLPLELPGRGAGCAGVVGLVVELPIEPLVEPEEPEPALARSSRRHFS